MRLFRSNLHNTFLNHYLILSQYIQSKLKKIYGIGDAKIKELIDKGIKSITDLEKNKHLLNKNQRLKLLE